MPKNSTASKKKGRKSEGKHLLFYDGSCALCQRSVRFVLSVDKKKIFLFAALDGKTAEKDLKDLKKKEPSIDSLVLLQDYQTPRQNLLIRGRAVLRLLWLLGGKWRLWGWLSFLPPGLFDLVYRVVARHRHGLFSTQKPIKFDAERFLP